MRLRLGNPLQLILAAALACMPAVSLAATSTPAEQRPREGTVPAEVLDADGDRHGLSFPPGGAQMMSAKRSSTQRK